MKQKHFIDIEHIREEDTELRIGNYRGFEVGDLIQITEKFDGSNACAAYDVETNHMIAFSRKQELSFNNTLNGFWNFVQAFSDSAIKEFQNHSSWRIFGEWSCLSGDTIIRKTSAGKNKPYMTLREMYQFLHTPTTDLFHYNTEKGFIKIINMVNNGITHYDEIFEKYKESNPDVKDSGVKTWITKSINKGYIIEIKNKIYKTTDEGNKYYNEATHGKNSWWNRHGMPSIFSLYQDKWKIEPNQVFDIAYTGNKPVYKVKTKNGFEIKSTLEHKFLTPNGFMPLSDLKEYDCVAVTRFFNEGRMSRSYGIGTKQIQDKQREYKKKIGKCEICGTDKCLNLHHKDGDYTNNNISNWQVLCQDCHKVKHKGTTRAYFSYNVEFDYITEIEYVGIEDCYDIMMEGEENEANYIANGFVVHNCKNKIVYHDTGKVKHWYVYDIYDTESKQWLKQNVVKDFCDKAGLEYIHILYEGEFISWEHCRSFMNNSAYGNTQEGIVVKNQSKLYEDENKNPTYLKIVNESFKESMKTREKIIDPEAEALKEEVRNIVESIVTHNRVEKELYKMRDEQILPEKMTPKDMRTIAQNLPKRIYTDCLKEEKELVIQCGELFNKMCQQVCMSHARNIVCE